MAHNRKQMQILKKQLTRDLDVSSPPNTLLDSESLGANTRVTNFVIAPTSARLSEVVNHFSNAQPVDLIANLIHHAMNVIEEPDPETRSILRSQFQSELFSSAQQLFLKKNFSLFAFFNRQIIEQVWLKIQPKKFDLISSLITQPLLRLAVQNKAIYIDPNAVIRITGVDGFKKISDLFLIQFWNLEPGLLDKFLSSFFTKNKQPQFDMIRVWMLIASDDHKLNTPLVPGSKWTLKKLMQLINVKKSQTILAELFKNIFKTGNSDLFFEIVSFSRSTHSITGTLKYPWAVQVIDQWMATNSKTFEPSLQIDDKLISTSAGPQASMARLSPTFPSWASQTAMIDSHESLMEFKKILFGSKNIFVGISFPSQSILSISFNDFSYLIDLAFVEPKFVSFILKRLLNDSECTKIVFSLSKFLLHVQQLIGDTSVHFENVVEIRGNRVRRLSRKSTGENFLTSAFCPGVEGLDELYQDTQSRTDHCEWFTESRMSSLRDLTRTWLGIDHDRKLCCDGDDWDIRPLPEEYTRVAAADSRVLVLLEERWRKEGIVPVEILSFDPFENS